MEFEKLISTRYSVRSYKSDPVPEGELHKVLDAARLAPTAANRQPFRIIVVHTENRKDELRQIYGREWFVQPPLVVCICALKDEAWVRGDGKSFSDVDAAIVMDHLILAAADRGLGTCWVGAFDARKARQILGLPGSAEPIAFTPLGYPADSPGAKQRKSVEQLVLYDRWS